MVECHYKELYLSTSSRRTHWLGHPGTPLVWSPDFPPDFPSSLPFAQTILSFVRKLGSRSASVVVAHTWAGRDLSIGCPCDLSSEVIARYNQLLWFRSNGQPIERSQLARQELCLSAFPSKLKVPCR